MSRNNHARTKEKRKKLKLKAFFKKVYNNRLEKLHAQNKKVRGITIIGSTEFMSELRRPVYSIFSYGHFKNMPTTQRKRRKMQRQTGRVIKKKAFRRQVA